MSVLVTMRVKADTAKFREYAEQHPDELRAISEDARSQGCRAHRFGVGEDFVFVIDEWESAEQFQGFFQGNPQIGEIMQAAGAQGEPEFTFSEAISTADQF
jgi:hypothetical protein